MAPIDLSDGDTLAILSIPVSYEDIRKVMDKNKWTLGDLNAHRFFHNSNVSLDDIFEADPILSFHLKVAAQKILAQWLSKKE